MNVEPSIHGLPDWHFPSPSSTPRSTAPEQAAFQTPKCEPSSHFLDAFYTPRVTGHQTPAATPVTYISSSASSAASLEEHSPANSPLTPQDPQFHVNHYNQGRLPLPPVDPARRLSSSRDSVQSSDKLRITISAPREHSGGQMDSFHLQTPPPTRDSSTRRQYDSSQAPLANNTGQMFPPAGLQTPIRAAPPALQQTPQYHTPVQYSQVQFSPGMFQYHNGAPASAPAMPNARFSWNTQSPSFSFADEALLSSQQDAYGPPQPISPGFAQWQTPLITSSQATYQSFSQPSQGPDFWTTPSISSQPQSSFNEQSSFASTITTTGVDPSMIFSFTNPAPVANTSPVKSSITPQKIDTALRQPYEHQTRESNREKELAKKAKQTGSRSSSGSASISFGRPSLQRSNTESSIRRPKMSFGESNRAAQILEQVDRRPSPLKRQSQISLTAIPESARPRPRTRLIIDDDGRARTETIDDTDSPRSSRQGFEMWDEDSSDDDIPVRSQRNSYGLAPDQMLQRRSSKHARTGSDVDRFDPSKRPLSSASVSSLASRLETTPLGKRSSRDLNFRRFSSGSYSAAFQSYQASPNKDDAATDDGNDAQAALKKLMDGRSRRSERNDQQAVLNAHNQRWSQASIDMAKLSALQEQSGAYDPFNSAGSNSLSPNSGTDPDILTPSTEHSTRSNDSIRCVCAMNDSDGQLMIQCESCAKWLHARCLPLDPQRLPLCYVCEYCTGTTPLARNGRIREHVNLRRPTEPTHASPLGYKSNNVFRR